MAQKDHQRSTFAENLRRLRRDKKLSVRGLAAASGVSYPQISRLEHDLYRPSQDTVDLLAVALGVDRSELMDDQSGTVSAQQIEVAVASFATSPTALANRVTEAELAWLRSRPAISWTGLAPTAEVLLFLVAAKRASER